mmetsp:Transcript_23310/g.42148  ORF Transcript_23310/g.42148 Transcript_23310/m.42148 type:complete len:316 (+) Transcript_23310:946-1893(+)
MHVGQGFASLCCLQPISDFLRPPSHLRGLLERRIGIVSEAVDFCLHHQSHDLATSIFDIQTDLLCLLSERQGLIQVQVARQAASCTEQGCSFLATQTCLLKESPLLIGNLSGLIKVVLLLVHFQEARKAKGLADPVSRGLISRDGLAGSRSSFFHRIPQEMHGAQLLQNSTFPPLISQLLDFGKSLIESFLGFLEILLCQVNAACCCNHQSLAAPVLLCLEVLKAFCGNSQSLSTVPLHDERLNEQVCRVGLSHTSARRLFEENHGILSIFHSLPAHASSEAHLSNLVVDIGFHFLCAHVPKSHGRFNAAFDAFL